MAKKRWIVLSSLVILIVSFSSLAIQKSTNRYTAKSESHHKPPIKDNIIPNPPKAIDIVDKSTDSYTIGLRKFPYPYNAMLAISSDIDDTTLDEFKSYHTFLNTKEDTPYGKGLGLDISDSMWIYMGSNSKDSVDTAGHGIEDVMTFYNGTDTAKRHNADEIIQFIHSGWIDSLHTFGDFSTSNEKNTLFNRKLALDGWKTLQSINFRPRVWINHGNRANVQNLGAYGSSEFMNYQQGDNRKSPYYHSDVTLSNGIRYIWNSTSDNNFGHDYPLYSISLQDKRKVWGFYRYTSDILKGTKNTIDWTWTPNNLYRQLTPEHLDDLIKNKHYSIVAQHFGRHTEDLFTEKNIKSLRLLEEYQSEKNILVARTSRLLNYADVQKYLRYTVITENGKTYINLDSINDPILGTIIPTLEDIRGITFYCDDPENTVVLLNKKIINSEEIQINQKDDTGKTSISIKWFQPDYTNYAS